MRRATEPRNTVVPNHRRFCFYRASIRYRRQDEKRLFASNTKPQKHRTAGDDEFSDVNYDIEVLEVYKSETGVEYATEINFATRGDTALCGVYLEIGEEYLLDLHRYEGALRSIGACGMTQPMLEVDEADVGSLENECADAIDNCDGECGKYQVGSRKLSYGTVGFYRKG